MRRYSKEFKINAVITYLESGKSQEIIMKKLDVGDRKTFSNWGKEYKSFGNSSFDKKNKSGKKVKESLSKDEEILKLKAENEMLKKILELQRRDAQKK